MLRAAKELQDLEIVARDGAADGTIGDVRDLCFDDEAWMIRCLDDEDSWAIRHLVVSTGNWWGGHDVLVSPQWTQRVSWAEQTVAVDLTREALKQAPWYDPALPLSREMENAVYTHDARAACWPDAENGSQRSALPPAA